MTLCLYTGTHHPSWLWNGTADYPLFVSHARLRGRKTPFPQAVVPGWALDSMGFSVLQKHGRWTVTPREYAEATARYDREIGRLEWASPQDHMCEQAIIYGGRHGGQVFAGTRQYIDPDGKLSYPQLVREHQKRTVANFLELSALWPQHSDEECPFMPVLQGRPGDTESYLECADLYERSGVDLFGSPVVGVGSVCRIQATAQAGRLARALATLGLGPTGTGEGYEPSLHWFGLKLSGIGQVWPHIGSCDSMAWSYAARRKPPLPGCTGHKNCANCPRAARAWRNRMLASIKHLGRRGWQEELFTGMGEAA